MTADELNASMRHRDEEHELERWRSMFSTAELVAECAQSALWLGDVDIPRDLTLDEIAERVSIAAQSYDYDASDKS